MMATKTLTVDPATLPPAKVSAFILARNSASTIARTIADVGPHVDEVHLLDTGSIDGTPGIAANVCSQIGTKFSFDWFTPETDRGMFVVDEKDSFGGLIPGPFTGQAILRDWSAALNQAAAGCEHEVVLRVDSDDLVSDPEKLRALASVLAASPTADVLMAPYDVQDGHGNTLGTHHSPRLWKKSRVAYQWVLHEQLRPATSDNRMVLPLGFRVTDVGDAAKGTVKYRNAKVLVAELLRMGREKLPTEPMFLYTVGHEMAEVNPDFAIELLDEVYETLAADSRQEANVLLHIGRAEQARGDLREALWNYETSATLRPSANAYALAAVAARRMGMEWRWHLGRAQKLDEENGGFGTWRPWLAEAAGTK